MRLTDAGIVGERKSEAADQVQDRDGRGLGLNATP